MRTILIFLLCCLPLMGYAQHKSKAWLPEEYIKAVVAGDTAAYRYTYPISGIMFDAKGKLMITGFDGEANPLRNKRVHVNGIEKYQLFGVHYHINLNRVPDRKRVDSLANATFFVTIFGEKALLEICQNNKKQDVVFVDHYGDYQFKGVWDAQTYLRKNLKAK